MVSQIREIPSAQEGNGQEHLANPAPKLIKNPRRVVFREIGMQNRDEIVRRDSKAYMRAERRARRKLIVQPEISHDAAE